MHLIKSIEELRAKRLLCDSVSFVPTMGALHDGHLSLVKLARNYADSVVMSVYVNPTQFNSKDDLVNYPKDIARDIELAKESGVDLLYVPDDRQIYGAMCVSKLPDNYRSVQVKAGSFADGLCGVYRSGHFDGVALVVAKLFNIVQPNFAIFGEKDYQQLQVVRQLVLDLCFPVTIIPAPIVREEEGLALSSRNLRLSKSARLESVKIFQSLCLADKLCRSGESDVNVLRDATYSKLNEIEDAKIEYIEIVDALTLQRVNKIDKLARLLLAVWVENVRLIDNISLSPNVLCTGGLHNDR